MIETERVPVTAPAQNIAPKNSASAPPSIKNLRESALEPYEVARPLAASLAPIEKAIRAVKIKVRVNQTSIFK